MKQALIIILSIFFITGLAVLNIYVLRLLLMEITEYEEAVKLTMLSTLPGLII